MDVQAELRRAILEARAGDWQAAHRRVQGLTGPDACHLHAILHRIEGDHENAGYWYARAGRTPIAGDPLVELDAVVPA